MRNRTLSRRMALQFLYMVHVRGEEVMDQLGSFLHEETNKQDVRNFAKRLIAGVVEHQTEIDEAITNVARNWRLERMAAIDLSVLRLAAYELMFAEDIPPVVSINEAIELVKDFSTDKSSSFVNGILDKINLQLKQAGQSSKAKVSDTPEVTDKEGSDASISTGRPS